MHKWSLLQRAKKQETLSPPEHHHNWMLLLRLPALYSHHHPGPTAPTDVHRSFLFALQSAGASGWPSLAHVTALWLLDGEIGETKLEIHIYIRKIPTK